MNLLSAPAPAPNLSPVAQRFLGDDSGATMVEYAVMVALIAAVCIIVIKALGSKSNEAFVNVNSALS